MASTFEDTVFNFDLQFLSHSDNNTVVHTKVDKQRKAIQAVKRKIFFADKLINKYNDKQELLDQTEKTLLSCKEECKKICIDYKNAMDKCSKLELDVQALQIKNQELQSKSIAAENNYEAIQSHCHQLQQLIKDKELCLETLKVENQLEKSNIQSLEKSIASLKKEKSVLIQEIRIISEASSRRKNTNDNNKVLLERYKTVTDKTYIESLSEAGIGDEVDILDEVSPSPNGNFLESEKAHNGMDKFALNQKNGKDSNKEEKHSLRQYDVDQDSDCSHELVSVDTGRGSSLAFSDSDKCFHSPDYFSNDSPINPEISGDKDNGRKVETGTSPMRVTVQIDASTSPIVFEHYRNTLVRSNQRDDSSRGPRIFIDGVSPINFSCLKETRNETVPSLNETISDVIHNKNDDDCVIRLQEKECLESNNINNLPEDNSDDSEIETILNIVRLDELITPIPSTPAKSRNSARLDELITPIPSTPAKSRGSVRLDELVTPILSTPVKSRNSARLEERITPIPSTPAKSRGSVRLDELITPIPITPAKSRGSAQLDELITQFPSTPAKSRGSVVKSPPTMNLYNEQTKFVCEDAARIWKYLRIHENSSNEKYSKSQRSQGTNCPEITNHKTEKSQVNNKGCAKNSFNSNVGSFSENILIQKTPQNIQPIEQSAAPIQAKILLANICDNQDNITPACIESCSLLSTSRNLHFEEVPEFNSLSHDSVEKEVASRVTENENKKLKNKKLTKLDKIRKKMLPKSKIQRSKTPSLKTFLRPKQLLPSKRKVLESDSSASLNDREVYERAVKVMYEINKNKLDKIVNKKRSAPPTNKRASSQSQAKGAGDKTIQCEEVASPCINTTSITSYITTRSRSKRVSFGDQKENNVEESNMIKKNEIKTIKMNEQESRRKQCKRASSEKIEPECKRILRSSIVNKYNQKPINAERELIVSIDKVDITQLLNHPTIKLNIQQQDKTKNYSDLNWFTEELPNEPVSQEGDLSETRNYQDSALHKTIEKYGLLSLRNSSKKISEAEINTSSKKIEEGIAKILGLPPNDVNRAMNELVRTIKTWDQKHFLTGLINYLKSPAQKVERFSKGCMLPTPPMTKSEQILLYIVMELKKCWTNIDIVDCILNTIEYTLFKLNCTPGFDTVESMSHFYALLCRYINAESRLKLFMVDAMYCIHFKAVPLIQQCIDAWSQIIPLAHMGVAKHPLVICLVYLLHFFKCEDRHNRVQALRNIMRQKYFYQITEWNDSKILDMFRASIMELSDKPLHEKTLRMALILFAKRHGALWCQNNIIKNLLQPMIAKENVPEKVKIFCVSMMGPLLKPYPVNMKAHCEMVMNQLIALLNNNASQSQRMEEAIMTSLMYMSKHDQNGVYQVMLNWYPKKLSPDFENRLIHHVRERRVDAWVAILSKISSQM